MNSYRCFWMSCQIIEELFCFQYGIVCYFACLLRDLPPVVSGLDVIDAFVPQISVKGACVSKMHLRLRRRLEEPSSPPSLHPGGLSLAALPELSDNGVPVVARTPGEVPPQRLSPFLPRPNRQPSESSKAPAGPHSNEIDSAFVVLLFVSRGAWICVFCMRIISKKM